MNAFGHLCDHQWRKSLRSVVLLFPIFSRQLILALSVPYGTVLIIFFPPPSPFLFFPFFFLCFIIPLSCLCSFNLSVLNHTRTAFAPSAAWIPRTLWSHVARRVALSGGVEGCRVTDVRECLKQNIMLEKVAGSSSSSR
ncbi:hypothetical protein, unlikely [Trypanosoma brucei brucei TREU927]|uniref:Uncharacterized protein n=1 Tax=Trypanosoma brucei brucei (strain 927/4 GUTat10.1) TaxID=185431 RepID=Q4GZF0_TRYB2|nr:hypothetical protein, unlikely [Trypanosoma brucei brucei TREU927]CAJ15954.1 hypothetical protein, unlikely [Trypanosoma brucei brucei TREU927]